MTRIAVTVLALCLLIGAAYWMGGRDNRLQDEIDIISAEDRINEAITSNPDCGWFDRLHNACP